MVETVSTAVRLAQPLQRANFSPPPGKRARAGLRAKLLRVLQEGRVLGVGEDTEVAVDTRVLAATNRDLAQMTATGNFRADLLHRLNVFPIRIPPLRERLADLKPLVAHFVIHKHGSLCPVGIPVVADEGVAGITLNGNARELENLVCQALVRNQGCQPLSLRDLSQEVWTELSEGERAERSSDSLAEATPPVDFMLAGLLEANAGSLSQCLTVCEKLLWRSHCGVPAAINRKLLECWESLRAAFTTCCGSTVSTRNAEDSFRKAPSAPGKLFPDRDGRTAARLRPILETSLYLRTYCGPNAPGGPALAYTLLRSAQRRADQCRRIESQPREPSKPNSEIS